MLQFSDQLDAQAFITSQSNPDLRYEFQSLDPEFDGQGFDKSDYGYELLITRAVAPEARAFVTPTSSRVVYSDRENSDVVLLGPILSNSESQLGSSAIELPL
jgi:hypothetical protein